VVEDMKEPIEHFESQAQLDASLKEWQAIGRDSTSAVNDLTFKNAHNPSRSIKYPTEQNKINL
jgi:hypothetical protein